MTLPSLIELVLADPPAGWSKTSLEQFESDANAVLESLLLEYGAITICEIVKKHGFNGNHGWVTFPLKEKALERRRQRMARQSPASSSD